jgi:hypothetical protein
MGVPGWPAKVAEKAQWYRSGDRFGAIVVLPHAGLPANRALARADRGKPRLAKALVLAGAL